VSVLLLAAVGLLVLLNGFFVASEFALVRARRSRIAAMERLGQRGAARALSQIDRIDEYLSACQLGITMASLGIGFLGEPAIARLLEEPLGTVLGHGVAVALAIAISYLIVTAAHITVGEQVPKIYAIMNAEATARWAAAPLHLFLVASRPLIWALNSTSNAILRLLGTDARAEFNEGSSPEELRLLITEGARGGTLERNEADMLSGVFHLHEQQARQVMTPFPAVVTVDADADAETALRRCIESGHTRLLVTVGDGDQVAGVVHNNSLVRLLLDEGPTASIGPAVREPLIVPETKPLDDLLADLRRERATMALVADEYGRIVGIVTIEDIVEEVVGEIADETDPVGGPVRRLANGDLYARGDVSLADLADLGVDLPADSSYSLGGLVFDKLGRLPKAGDVVRSNGYSLLVEAVRGTRIETVRIRGDHRPPGSGSS
jgi:CBS domain containing-hemolysin-like protein